MMKSALLVYCKLVVDLQYIGVVLSPFDPCIAKKMIEDLFMIGHKDHKAVPDTIQWLQTCYKTPDKPL